MPETSFNIEQAVQAQRSLRAALGLGEEEFPVAAFVQMVSDEIEQLRSAGRTDQDIVDIVAQSTGKTIDPADIARHYVEPADRHSHEG